MHITLRNWFKTQALVMEDSSYRFDLARIAGEFTGDDKEFYINGPFNETLLQVIVATVVGEKLSPEESDALIHLLIKLPNVKYHEQGIAAMISADSALQILTQVLAFNMEEGGDVDLQPNLMRRLIEIEAPSSEWLKGAYESVTGETYTAPCAH